jgi:hypothetical protein
MDAEACIVAVSSRDTSVAPSSSRLATDVAACADDSPGCNASACGVTATPDCPTSVVSTRGAPSSVYSPMDAAAGCASPIDTMDAPAPLLLASSTMLVDSWHTGRTVRLFFGATLRGVLPLPTLQRARRSAYGKIHRSKGAKSFSTHLGATRW